MPEPCDGQRAISGSQSGSHSERSEESPEPARDREQLLRGVCPARPLPDDAAKPRTKTAAFFDVDGTIAHTTIAHFYAYFMRQRLTPFRRKLWSAWFLAKCVYYLALDKIDRGRLNLVFYRNYARLACNEIKSMAEGCHGAVIWPRRYPEALKCIATHRRAGDLVIFVTGSLDFIMEPLAKTVGASRVVSARLAESDGVFTGALCGPPFGSAEKARMVSDLAAGEGIDLSRSHAYGDSVGDLGMLEAVGHAHVVNPGRRLAGIAQARGWTIHRWSRAPHQEDDVSGLPEGGAVLSDSGAGTLGARLGAAASERATRSTAESHNSTTGLVEPRRHRQ